MQNQLTCCGFLTNYVDLCFLLTTIKGLAVTPTSIHVMRSIFLPLPVRIVNLSLLCILLFDATKVCLLEPPPSPSLTVRVSILIILYPLWPANSCTTLTLHTALTYRQWVFSISIAYEYNGWILYNFTSWIVLTKYSRIKQTPLLMTSI